MGHSFGGATALTAACRRPDLAQNGGGVIAHDPATDWIPDDTRRSLFPPEKLKDLETAKGFAGGTGGYKDEPANDRGTLHDLDFLLLFSHQWKLSVSDNCLSVCTAEV